MNTSSLGQQAAQGSGSSTSDSLAPCALAEHLAQLEHLSSAVKSDWDDETFEAYGRRIVLMHSDDAEKIQCEDDKTLAERRARKDALLTGFDNLSADLRDASARLKEVSKTLTAQRTNQLELLAQLNEYLEREEARKAKQEARFLARLFRRRRA